MDQNNHNKLISQNQLKKSPMVKFWSQIYNVLPEGMPQKMNYQKRQIKCDVDLLNEEKRKERRKKELKKQKKVESQITATTRAEDHLSEKVKKMLNKIGKNVNHIKESIKDITKMNSLYLEEKAKKTFLRTHQFNTNYHRQNNSASDISSISSFIVGNLNKNNNKSKENTSKENNSKVNTSKEIEMMKEKMKDDEKKERLIKKIEEKYKKDNYTKNFMYVNDNYRRQLNFAFLKYNTEQHLENIKFLVQIDPAIRNDIANIVEDVEKDIKWKCDKNHFAKKYIDLIEKNKNRRLLEELAKKEVEKENEKDKKNKSILPKIKSNQNMREKYKPKNFKKKSMSQIYKKINYNLKHNKKELIKLNALKEQAKEEINHMIDASKEIDNFLQNENINNKIDMYKTDYERQMYGYYPGNEPSHIKNENILDKDYFLEEKNNIVNKIGNVLTFKMDKTYNEQEKMFKGKIYDEAKKFRKRIIDGKKNALDEFKGYITNYQVKLPNSGKEEESSKILLSFD